MQSSGLLDMTPILGPGTQPRLCRCGGEGFICSVFSVRKAWLALIAIDLLGLLDMAFKRNNLTTHYKTHTLSHGLLHISSHASLSVPGITHLLI